MNYQLEDARLKLNNAAEHISKIKEIFTKQRPFTYVVETNTETNLRATFAKRNKAAIGAIATMSGDVFYNLRASLDYAYWQIVSPLVTEERKKKYIQFPFCKNADRLKDILETRCATLVGQDFVIYLSSLKPYGGPDGNNLLYLLEQLAMPDRHRYLTPVGDFKTINSADIFRQVPDFPSGFYNCIFGNNERDFVWQRHQLLLRTKNVGNLVSGSYRIFEKELDVHIEAFFIIGDTDYSGAVIPTLENLYAIVESILNEMEKFI